MAFGVMPAKAYPTEAPKPTDMRMPVMDGLEATRRIKSQWPEIRVVALSMDPVYQPKARAAGTDVFLLKGCGAEELQAALVATV